MTRKSKFAILGTILMTALFAAPANAFNVNKSIKVPAGNVADGASTVNGSVSIGAGATINGSVDTVNGTIRIDENARMDDVGTVNGGISIATGVTARDVSSVNGSIKIAENVVVDGEVSVVNGKISLAKGTRVTDSVSNVNGQMLIVGAEIGGDLETVSGDITLTDGATLQGDLNVEKPGGWSWGKRQRTPRVIIGPNSRVFGTLNLEQKVELFISDSAEVGGVSGEMSMADAVRFSGAEP